MDPLFIIRILLYYMSAMVLLAIGIKMFITASDLPRCDLKTGMNLFGASMFFFWFQLMGWGVGDVVKALDPALVMPITIVMSVSAIFVLGTMFAAVMIIERYLKEA